MFDYVKIFIRHYPLMAFDRKEISAKQALRRRFFPGFLPVSMIPVTIYNNC